MPPKAKFTREEVVAAALGIVRESGMRALTARRLAKALNSSPCPVFTLFSGIEEVQSETVAAAKKVYASYVSRGLSQTPPFKGVGMEYIRFAQEERELFRLLFMSSVRQAPPVFSALGALDDNSEAIVGSVRESYPFLSAAQAERAYQHMSIYSHGIAVLCATGACSFQNSQIGAMLTEMMKGLLKQMASEVQHDTN